MKENYGFLEKSGQHEIKIDKVKEEIKNNWEEIPEYEMKKEEVKVQEDQLLLARDIDIYGRDFFRNPYLIRDQKEADTVKLGSKTWKPNEAEKEKNRRIDAAKSITKKATGYTLDIHNEIESIQRSIAEDSEEDQEPEEQQEYFTHLLESVRFTAKMFSGAYIAKNFRSCYELALAYKKIEANILDPEGDLPEEKRLMYESAALFSKRVWEFCKRNHIDPETGAGFDGEPLKEEQITEDEERSWLLLTDSQKNLRREKRQNSMLNDLFGPGKELLSEKEVANLREAKNEIPYADFMYSPNNYIRMSPLERVRALPDIRGHIETLEKARKEAEAPAVALELRKQLIELYAIEKLAETEFKAECIRLERGGEFGPDEFKAEYPELLKELTEKSDNLRRIEKRYDELVAQVDSRTVPEGIKKLSREEAISTESDRLAYEKRVKLLQVCEKIGKDANKNGFELIFQEELKKRVQKYYDTNFYREGDRKEAEAMKAVLAFVKENHIDTDPAYEEFMGVLKSSTNGNLGFDPENPPQEYNYIDKGEGTAKETRPQTSDSKEQPLCVRTIAKTLKTFTKWEDRRDEPLFAHEPTVNDLRQGKVSNCWMVSATTALINFNPQIIKDCMQDNGDGTVTVRLYTDKEDKETGAVYPVANYIRVKKETPKLVSGGAVHTSGALWMQMLEKAAAFIGYRKPNRQNPELGYNALWHGTQGDWLFALTGNTDDRIFTTSRGGVVFENDRYIKGLSGYSNFPRNMEEAKKDEKFLSEMFKDIAHAKENGFLYTYGTRHSGTPGMNTGHAYTVLGAREVNGERYVVLRNPYGNMNAVYDEKGKLKMTESYLSSEMNETFGQFMVKLSDFVDNAGVLTRFKISNKPLSKEEAIENKRKRAEELKNSLGAIKESDANGFLTFDDDNAEVQKQASGLNGGNIKEDDF